MELVFATRHVKLYHTDCLDWLGQQQPETIHAVVTDPPYGMLEYSPEHLGKMRNGRGGVWRIPPTIGGSKRAPLPRFTVLSNSDVDALRKYFNTWAQRLMPALVPGAHVIVASSPLLSYVLSDAVLQAGFEKRGEVVRLVRTLRGGD